MLLTEEEARTKWCPFAAGTSGSSEQCMASDCIAWRGNASDYKQDEFGESILVDVGYCGLVRGSR